jgi:hypothetical protein
MASKETKEGHGASATAIAESSLGVKLKMLGKKDLDPDVGD